MSDDLNVLLKKRAVPEVSGDLADRIIAAAESRQEAQVMVVFQWFRPAAMMAAAVAVLVLAVVFANGVNFAESLDTPDEAMDEIAMYMVYESLEIPL